jgi:hypothetical protein
MIIVLHHWVAAYLPSRAQSGTLRRAGKSFLSGILEGDSRGRTLLVVFTCGGFVLSIQHFRLVIIILIMPKKSKVRILIWRSPNFSNLFYFLIEQDWFGMFEISMVLSIEIKNTNKHKTVKIFKNTVAINLTWQITSKKLKDVRTYKSNFRILSLVDISQDHFSW